MYTIKVSNSSKPYDKKEVRTRDQGAYFAYSKGTLQRIRKIGPNVRILKAWYHLKYLCYQGAYIIVWKRKQVEHWN